MFDVIHSAPISTSSQGRKTLESEKLMKSFQLARAIIHKEEVEASEILKQIRDIDEKLGTAGARL